MSGIKLNMETEIDALRANVTALQAMTKKTAQQCVRETSVMVLQTGANLTPQAKRARREVIRAVRRYRHGVEELARGARPEAPGDKALFLIARPRGRKPIAKSGDRRFWTFETAAAAKDHTEITFRGVGKAGWWSQLPSLGKPVPGKYAKVAYMADLPGLKSSSVKLEELIPVVTLVNKASSIQRRADSIRTLILSKVTGRIAGMAKANERRLAAFRQAGGVVWDEASREYTPMEV